MSGDYHSDYQSNRAHGLSGTHSAMLALGRHQARQHALASQTGSSLAPSSAGMRHNRISWRVFWGVVFVLAALATAGAANMAYQGEHVDLEILLYSVVIAVASAVMWLRESTIKPVVTQAADTLGKVLKVVFIVGIVGFVIVALLFGLGG